MYHIYTRTLPPPIHLCEQDFRASKVHKKYTIYPELHLSCSLPAWGFRLLYLHIKYASPVKLLCWEHSGDPCNEGKVREGRGGRVGVLQYCPQKVNSALHKACLLQGPRALGNAGWLCSVVPRLCWWGTGNQKCSECSVTTKCLTELHQHHWVTATKPCRVTSAQAAAQKQPTKGLLQNIKLQRVPLGSSPPDRGGLNSTCITEAGFTLRGGKQQYLTNSNSLQGGTSS